jgi:hypothetical protein
MALLSGSTANAATVAEVTESNSINMPSTR